MKIQLRSPTMASGQIPSVLSSVGQCTVYIYISLSLGNNTWTKIVQPFVLSNQNQRSFEPFLRINPGTQKSNDEIKPSLS